MNIFFSLSGLIGSVLLLLYSVISFGRIIKLHANNKIKKILSSITSNHVKSVFFGFLSTIVSQSSTTTTLVLASLVDTNVIHFGNSVGIIFGSNLASTITTQLIAFNVMSFSPYIIIFGVLLYITTNRKDLSKSLIYFGLLFYSVYLISVFSSMIDKSIIESFLSLSSNIFFTILIGIIMCAILQSSSVVLGLILVLASGGSITLTQSIGLILGANIGTTSTVLIASTAMNTGGKRVALGHFLFNFLGVIIFLPLIDYFIKIVNLIGGSEMNKIANIHFLFNFFCVFVFLLLIKPFSSLITRLVK